MNIFDFYSDSTKHTELSEILTLGAQKHPSGLSASFLEKDIWVTEILRLLYEEDFLSEHRVAFKGGTALSKCWQAIERFSEDIDLSIHWADLSDEDNEDAAWLKTTSNRSQQDKFRKAQEKRLVTWSENLVTQLNQRFSQYNIDGLQAELEQGSRGEKIDIHFPRVTSNENSYQLDHILLEFGARNRGHPTIQQPATCYLSQIPELSELKLPACTVNVLDPSYILWEKLTALHQFSTQEREPPPDRLARHWYDVDCLIKKQIEDPLNTNKSMLAVVEMKKSRWSERGVDYDDVPDGKLRLIPEKDRLKAITQDHENSVDGGMFFTRPDDFSEITKRLTDLEKSINAKNITMANHRLVYSGEWVQAVIELKGKTLRSPLSLNAEKELLFLHQLVAELL